MPTQLISEWAFGERAMVDENPDVVGVVTGLRFRGEPARPMVELSWVTPQGVPVSDWFDAWRLSESHRPPLKKTLRNTLRAVS